VAFTIRSASQLIGQAPSVIRAARTVAPLGSNASWAAGPHRWHQDDRLADTAGQSRPMASTVAGRSVLCPMDGPAHDS
jgi:hypothetical protein